MTSDATTAVGWERRRQTYPEYRASGVDWFNEVPAHWTVAPLYARYEVQLGRMLDQSRVNGPNRAPYLRNVDVQWDHVNTDDLPEMDFPPSARTRYRLQTDDLLVCEGGEVGRAAMWRSELPECYYQKALHRLRRRCLDDSPRFLYYVMYAAASQGAFRAQSSLNTIDHLTAEKLRRHRFPFPPSNEQHGAADFLDRETGGIDVLAAKKQRMIELLHEKRAALISRAVTKGLAPDSPMKDSGIEWLGEVPADWQVMRLSRVTKSRCDGPFGSGLKSDHYTDAGRRVIRLQNIASGRFDHRDRAFVDEDYYREHLGEHDVLPGDVLIAGLGDETHPVGRACVMPDGLGDAMVKADCFRFRIDLARAEPHFLALQLSATAAATSALLSSGATRTRVNMTTMATRSIAVPPLSEQRAIVSGAEAADGQLERLTSRVTRVVKRLQEYRSALIAAVVTGQIDVRTYRRDPEEVLEAS